jgi:hypothetical protein
VRPQPVALTRSSAGEVTCRMGPKHDGSPPPHGPRSHDKATTTIDPTRPTLATAANVRIRGA